MESDKAVGKQAVTFQQSSRQDEGMDNGLEEYVVPEGLSSLLHDFAVAVLMDKPDDLPEFAATYFTVLSNKEKARQVPMYIIVDNDEEAGEPDLVRRISTVQKPIGRRKSVSAERYDPEEDNSNDAGTLPSHPKTDEQRTMLRNAVQSILVFRTLDDEQVMRVIDAMGQRTVQAGDTVIRQGDDGDFFYVIAKGIYDVYINEADGEETKVTSYDEEGSFGELALMYSQPRSATVRACTSGVLWAMDRKSFQKIVIRASMNNRRMYELLLTKVPFLKPLSQEERSNVVDALCTRVFYSDQCIVEAGEAGNGMYFIEQGECCVRMDKGNGFEEEITRLLTGQYFGELALLENSSRTASVYAVGRVKCAFLERESFERLLGPCRDIMKRATSNYELH